MLLLQLVGRSHWQKPSIRLLVLPKGFAIAWAGAKEGLQQPQELYARKLIHLQHHELIMVSINKKTPLGVRRKTGIPGLPCKGMPPLWAGITLARK